MKKRISLALLVVFAAFFSVAVVSRKYFEKTKTSSVAYSVVVPQLSSKESSAVSAAVSVNEENAQVSLLPLNGDETLISAVSMDFDGDGFDDQINAIKTFSSRYISILIGLYNPKNSAYERKAVIATEISQAQTFSYTGIDLTGEHKNSLVYQGFAENGDSVLQAFSISVANGKFVLKKIADLRGDGTIFVQQTDRFDAYERSKANGESFPIWVYTSDTENGGVDQLQILYEWNSAEQKYVRTKTIRVAGSRLAAKELARIQDGTVSTFAGFLNGLWYMSDGGENSQQYIFFDYDSREVIFFRDDTEEVYNWIHSALRRNGMYVSAINQEIENLQRKIDISLKSTAEIQVRIQDDVKMLISESAVWDGNYKKTDKKNVAQKKIRTEKSLLVKSVFEKENSWKTGDDFTLKFADGKYQLAGKNFSESGTYIGFEIQGENFIQFRCDSAEENFRMNGLYRIDEDSAAEKKFVLQPYKILADGKVKLDSRPLTIFASAEKSDDSF
jgi:hypothetical protein